MTEFEEKMLNETRSQTEILSKIKSYAFMGFVLASIILGVLIAK